MIGANGVTDDIMNLLLNFGMVVLLGIGGPRVSRMLGDRVGAAVRDATSEIVAEMDKIRTDAVALKVRQDRTDDTVREIHDVVVNQILPIVAEGSDNRNGEKGTT